MGKRIVCVIIIGFILFLPVIAQNNFIIIVNKTAQNESINRASIESIFLGKKSRWSDGSKIVPVTLKEGAAHEAFIQEMVQKSTTAYMNYWRKMIFTGKGVMPISFESETEVVEYVNRTPGAIGYISSKSALTGSDDVVVAKLEE